MLVHVADTGVGIPADLVPKIFDPYEQAHRGRGGSGVGLTVVRSLVEAHGGTCLGRVGRGSGAAGSCSRSPSPRRRSGARSVRRWRLVPLALLLAACATGRPRRRRRRRPPRRGPRPPTTASRWSGSLRAGRSRAPTTRPCPSSRNSRTTRARRSRTGRSSGSPGASATPNTPGTTTGRPSWSPIAWCASLRTRSIRRSPRVAGAAAGATWRAAASSSAAEHGAGADGHRAGATDAGAGAAEGRRPRARAPDAASCRNGPRSSSGSSAWTSELERRTRSSSG